MRGSLSLGDLTLLGGYDFSENAQLQTVLHLFRLERPRPGRHLPAGSPGADLFGRADRQVGGDYIGPWSGANLGAFFERIGADTTVKYLASRSAYALRSSSASRTPNW